MARAWLWLYPCSYHRRGPRLSAHSRFDTGVFVQNDDLDTLLHLWWLNVCDVIHPWGVALFFGLVNMQRDLGVSIACYRLRGEYRHYYDPISFLACPSHITLASFGMHAVMGVGYGLMKATTPTEEQLYNEMAPDLRRKVDANRAARLAREAEMKKQVDAQVVGEKNPEAAKPIWADPPSSKK
ncbi:hypothetical protein CVT25_011401 [Psilocybe cyanescens]|uniref:Uncharacterized protein n=1 Tax=Psilocybe cyanescens TaxID=93625 RepID=A0A409WGH6_PSICY|nr:hypothetical protein CVT25_011401 [Psilocybe cyanescens]